MYKRIRYILLVLLFSGAIQALAQIAMPEKVCVGTESRYWVDGTPGSTYTWKIDGVMQSSTINEINITWTTAGEFKLEVQEHQNLCDGEVQMGMVTVYDQPRVFAGNPAFTCGISTVSLFEANAANYSKLIWTTSGDGTFNHANILNPIYIPGPSDHLAGSVTLTLTAEGLGKFGSCTEPGSSLTLTLNPLPNLIITDPAPVCYPETVDLTNPDVSAGSDPDLFYEYFTDAEASNSIPDPKAIAVSGTYYIKATTESTGCFTLKPVGITIIPLPVLVINDPAAVCQPETVDLSAPAITADSETGLTYSYYTDAAATVQLEGYTAISVGGIYYIKATNPLTSCSIVEEVTVTINPLPVLVITDPPEKCFPKTIDLSSETIIAGSSIPPSTVFSYWMDEEATMRVPNEKVIAVSGIYYIKAVEPGGCSSENRAVNVTIHPLINFVIINPAPVCEPATVDLTLPLVTAGSDLGLTYEYYTDIAATNPLGNFTALATSGTYYIKAIQPLTGCSDVKPVQVTVDILLTPVFSMDNELCVTDLAPTLPTISENDVSGTWSPSTVDMSTPGTVKYTFTPDAGQCAVKYEQNITITDHIYSKFAPIGPFCVGSPATLPATSPNGITGTWSPSTISTATSGTYPFKFTPDANQCALDTTLQIQVNDPITPTFDPVEACQNTTISPLPPKSKEGISGTWSPAFTSEVVGPANYTFKPDPDQCANNTTLTITVNPERYPEFASIGPFCVNLNPAPSLPSTSMNGMSGTWTPAVISTSTIGTSNYLFTPDSRTCGLPVSVPVTIMGLSLSATTVDLGYSTLPIGEIDLTVSDGSGDYSYSWTGLNGFTASSQDLTGLAVGDYTVIVTDIQTGCEETKTIPIKNNFLVDYTYDPVTCFGYANGKATAIIAGGTPPYHYSWKKDGLVVSTDQTVTNLVAGNYTLEANDNMGLGMPKPAEFTITQPERLRISVTIKNVSCFGANDGSVSVTVTGGPTAAETVIWINGLKTNPLNGLSKGEYVVHIENPCGRDTVVKIAEPPVMTLNASGINAFCYGDPGHIQLSSTHVPDGIYEVFYDGGQFSGVQVLSNSAKIPAFGGTYKNLRLLVDECLVSGNDIVLNDAPEIRVTASVTAQPTCIDAEGVIRLSSSSGPGLTYSIDGTDYTNTDGLFPKLTAGDYVGTVKNLNGCISSPSNMVTIIEQPDAPAKPIAQATSHPTCKVATGTITVISPTGTGLSYSLDGKTFDNTSGIFPGLASGNYQITAKISGGCTSVISDKVSIQPQPATPSAPIAIQVPPECEKVPIQKIYARSGIATPPAGVTINWYDEKGLPVSDPFLNEIGTVTYFAESSNGACVSATRTAVNLTINPAPMVPVSKNPAAECAMTPVQTLDARMYISDVPGENLNWWDSAIGGNKVINPILNTIGSKTYYAEAFNGVCPSPARAAVTLTINPLPAAPEAQVTVNPTCNFPNGTVVVTSPKEGTGFEYNIDGGIYQTSATFTLLKWGAHLVRVKHTSSGCESETATSVFINAIPPAPVLTISAIENCICYGGNGSISFTVTNAKDGIYKITYDDGEFENVRFTGGKAKVIALAGTYNNLTIDANGCTSEPILTATVAQPTLISLTETITEIDLKSGRKGAIDLHVTGGLASYTYLWSNGETTEDIKDLMDGTYSVIVVDNNGCKQTKLITIPIPNFSPVAVADEFSVGCDLITGSLIVNDSDPEGDPFHLDQNPVEKPLHGSLTLNEDGTFEYQPDLRFSGTDYFRYAIYDAKNYLGDTAKVVLNIIGDVDCDGTANEIDPDTDGDGILNVDEGGLTADNDEDGIPNYLDIDSDNDGIVDNVEAQSSSAYIHPLNMDTDGDGLDDAYDPDQKGKRIVPVDTDIDGIPDYLDSDSDNDLVPDYIEGHDLLGDGKADFIFIGKDSDQDGLDDAYDTVNRYTTSENITGSNAAIQDFDGDGKHDWRDENDDEDSYLTRFEDLNADGNFSNDDIDKDGHPEYLDYGRDCDLFIPNIFTPNSDNIHDYFLIYCIDHYPNAKIYIFDQTGNKVFEKDHYGNLEYWGSVSRAWWNGRNMYKGNESTEYVPIGTYFYVLILGNGEVKKSYVFISY